MNVGRLIYWIFIWLSQKRSELCAQLLIFDWVKLWESMVSLCNFLSKICHTMVVYGYYTYHSNHFVFDSLVWVFSIHVPYIVIIRIICFFFQEKIFRVLKYLGMAVQPFFITFDKMLACGRWVVCSNKRLKSRKIFKTLMFVKSECKQISILLCDSQFTIRVYCSLPPSHQIYWKDS